MKITNTTTRDLGLDPETVIAAGGSIEIDNEVLSALKKSPVVKGWFVAKKLIEIGEVKAEKPKAEKQEPKPKTYAKKADK